MVVNRKIKQLINRTEKSSIWSISVLVVCLLILGPFFSMLIVATDDSGGLWPHLMQTVFPRYVFNTLILMFGVGAVSLFFGLSSAWVISRYNFPGDRYIEWILLLPATVPSYIIAYTYTDLLEYAGPIQGFLRKTFGWDSDC